MISHMSERRFENILQTSSETFLNVLLKESNIICIMLQAVGSTELDVILSNFHINVQISKTMNLCRKSSKYAISGSIIQNSERCLEV